MILTLALDFVKIYGKSYFVGLRRVIYIIYKGQLFISRMLKELKAPQNNSNAWCSQSDRLQMAEDTLRQVFHIQ